MDTKNPMDFINILGCTGLNFSYDDKLKVVGGVGLALGFLNLFALLCSIIFCFCFNAARGLSSVDALKGEEPDDEPSSSSPNKGRRRPSEQSTPGSLRRQRSKKALRASKEKLNTDDDDDDLPPDAYKDLLDKSRVSQNWKKKQMGNWRFPELGPSPTSGSSEIQNGVHAEI